MNSSVFKRYKNEIKLIESKMNISVFDKPSWGMLRIFLSKYNYFNSYKINDKLFFNLMGVCDVRLPKNFDFFGKGYITEIFENNKIYIGIDLSKLKLEDYIQEDLDLYAKRCVESSVKNFLEDFSEEYVSQGFPESDFPGFFKLYQNGGDWYSLYEKYLKDGTIKKCVVWQVANKIVNQIINKGIDVRLLGGEFRGIKNRKFLPLVIYNIERGDVDIQYYQSQTSYSSSTRDRQKLTLDYFIKARTNVYVPNVIENVNKFE